MLENRDIVVICGMRYFDKYMTSKQQIASRLARKNRVLFVEKRHSYWPWGWPKWAKFLAGGRVAKAGENLWILPAVSFFPMQDRNRVSAKAGGAVLKNVVSSAIRELGMKDPVLWSFVHDYPGLFGGVGESIGIYHCVDNWSAFPSASREMALELEAETARKADVVFATSRPLAKRLEGLNANVHYLPNAADTELFEKTMDPGTEVAEEMRKIKKPVAGFVGTLDGWFDSELVRKAARLRRDWSFVIVGTKFPEFKDDALLKEENIHYLGLKPRSALPSYIKGMDACIIPFAINELTLSVSPLKLYEYIAAGKPVVSTRMPEVESVGTLARVADTPEQFVAALDACLKDNTAKQLAERRKFASQNTWDARVDTLSGWIMDALKAGKAR